MGGLHSLSLVNREIAVRLDGQVELSILPAECHPAMGVPELPLPESVARRLRRTLSRPAEVHVKHRWPADLRPPAEGRFVLMQPWEYGSAPKRWVNAAVEYADEVWANTRYVRDCFVEGGVPAERVAIVPLGVDARLYRPEAEPLPLRTRRRWKFLFVGGTIRRKGFDLLLQAYARAFTAADDVCLVVKDMGKGTFYQGQTGERELAELMGRPNAPEIEYIDAALTPAQQAGLYTACDCLVAPYRGEGFGLPIAEAMASGLPVVLTGMGAAMDYCNEETAFLLPARRVDFPERRVGNEETVGIPWLAEVDREALAYRLKWVYDRPEEARARGRAGGEHIRANFTWQHTASAVVARLRELATRPIFRQQRPRVVVGGPDFQSGLCVARHAEAGLEIRPTGTKAGLEIRPTGTKAGLEIRPTGEARAGLEIRPTGNGKPFVPDCLLSVTIIARNEEANIGECLSGIIDIADQVVIADTGSTDRTKEIAASFGPKVKIVDFPWVKDFAAARNAALQHATGKWVLWLDADDRIDDRNRQRLRELIASLKDENAAYAEKGETPRGSGLRVVIEEFLAKGIFRVKSQSEQGQGLTVLERSV